MRHVLFDADGVMQRLPGGWYAAMEPYVGERSEEFLRALWDDEPPILVGNGDYLRHLGAMLAQFGVEESADEVFAAVWHRIDVDAESVAIVRALKDQGIGVHLGTNQVADRASYMRANLGYGELFDVQCYSCELGVAKPEPAFFVEAARRIGTTIDEILFIDDSLRNVEEARAAGMSAEHWSLEQGHTRLRRVLASHGLCAG